MKTIYLDNGATTEIDPKVAEAINKAPYGNASSIHHKGQEAKKALNNSRNIIAKSINANPKEIIFTSGGTEANNLALKGIALANKNKGNHIIISKIEHDCVLNAARWLKTQGFKITELNVDKEGHINLEQLKKEITKNTILVSIIHGNNEIGTIQNLKAIYNICQKNNTLFHTDACQSYTKTNISKDDADLITLNAHKIHGPKGVGALYIREGIQITPLQHGGGHERNLRSGTENISGIVGFAKAVEIAKKSDIKKMQKHRDYLITELLKIPDTQLNGPKERLCNNVNVSFHYIEGESLQALLDSEGICSSTGSACSSHTLEPSHVIMALENNPGRAHGSLRFTLSKNTTKEELDFTIKTIKEAVNKLRNISPLGGAKNV